MCGLDRTEVLPAAWRRAAEGLDHLEHMTPASEADAVAGDPLVETLRSPPRSPQRPRAISYDRAIIPFQLPACADFARSRSLRRPNPAALALAAALASSVVVVAFHVAAAVMH